MENEALTIELGNELYKLLKAHLPREGFFLIVLNPSSGKRGAVTNVREEFIPQLLKETLQAYENPPPSTIDANYFTIEGLPGVIIGGENEVSIKPDPKINKFDTVYLDIETQKGSDDVGGWIPQKMGLAVAVTHDNINGYKYWFENQVVDLINHLSSCKKIIGFNLKSFDYEVLMAYDNQAKSILIDRTVDMLEDIYHNLGFRIKLDDLVQATLGKSKSGDGLQSIKWWKEGKQQLVVDYCVKDVNLTKELYEFGKANKFINYPSYGRKKSVSVSW